MQMARHSKKKRRRNPTSNKNENDYARCMYVCVCVLCIESAAHSGRNNIETKYIFLFMMLYFKTANPLVSILFIVAHYSSFRWQAIVLTQSSLANVSLSIQFICCTNLVRHGYDHHSTILPSYLLVVRLVICKLRHFARMPVISMQHGTKMGKRNWANERFEKQKMRYEKSKRAGECIAD